MVQNVSNQQPQQPGRGRVFLNALSQTALTAGVGAAGGAGVSALASVIIPPKKEKILAQYTDAFLQATTGDSGTNTLKDLVSRTSSDTFACAQEVAPKIMAGDSAFLISKMTDEEFGKIGEDALKKFGLKGTSYTRESAVKELGEKAGADIGGDIKETVKKIGEKAKESYDAFTQKAKESFESLAKDNDLYKLSRKSAKSANRKTMMGKGIKIGIVVALLGSFVLSFIASKRAKKQAQQQAAMEAAAQKQAQSAQAENQITPEQAQMMAQMMAQQQNAIPETPVQAQSAMPQIRPLEAQQTAQMPMPQQTAQAPIQPQIAQDQTAQESAAQYFKTPMPSPLI